LPRIPAACIQLATPNLERAQDLVRQALQNPSQPRLIVLPEHLVPQCPSCVHPVIDALADMARAASAIICVGVHTPAPQDAACDFSNIAMLIGPEGRILTEQPKMVPLPFFRDGEPGRSQTIARTRYGHLGTYICYDGLFTDWPRRVVNAGAELLLVPNLDDPAWPTQQRWQHADMATFRSIELRRCAVRANGAGVSQIIDATGRPIAIRTRNDGDGLALGDVYLCNDRTAFARGGHLFAPAIAIAFLAMVAWLTWKEKQATP
jgi:apolipoprotein N-acyltransferase